MKIIVSALIVVFALSQAAEAKEKIPLHGHKVVKTENTPPLDQTVTGGTVATAGSTATRPAYPEALDLHF